MEIKMSKKDQQVNFSIHEETLERFKIETVKDRRTQTAQLVLIIEEWLEARANKEAKA